MPLTDCAILSGYTKDCRNSIGGIKTVYITELSSKSSITSASGNISAFTLIAGRRFYTFDLEQAVGNYSCNPKPNAANGSLYFEQTLNIKIPKFAATFAYQIKNLAANDLMIIALRQSGEYVLLGEANGMKMGDGTGPSGVAMGDFGGFDLNFTAMEPDAAKTINAGLIAGLL